MAEAVPLSPQKDDTAGSPLPSPSNPDIETETEPQPPQSSNIEDTDDKPNDTPQENNDTTNNDHVDMDLEDGNTTNDNEEDEDEPNTEIKPSITMILDQEELPQTHNREQQFSTNKILDIAKQLDTDKKPQNDDNEEKEQKQTQKQIQIKVEHGHTSKQGIRPSMEDQVVVEASFIVTGSKCTSGNLSIYGVFDGHGGSQCAEFCAANLKEILKKYLLITDNVSDAFNLCIAELDTKAIEHAKDASGSTACMILIDNTTYDLWCCNVGDSRSVLINSSYTTVKQLSVEHKPDYPLEKQRIEQANGWVTFGRVCGILAVSRSLGDKDFKYEIENLVISTPDITHHKLTFNEDKFVIVACDGLYDVFTNEQCMQWLEKNSNDSISMQDLTDKLCHTSIYDRKTKDNVSIIIVKIDHHEVEVDITSTETDNDGQEAMIMDEIKDEKFYNSTSSNGSGQSALSPHDINDSLQSQLSNGSNMSQGDGNNNVTSVQPQTQPKKHKFHVVMASDDGLTDNLNETDISNMTIDETEDGDDVESK
eukprot:CAMPEP_0201578948 /NCGR_PEP_ID=MMETSP0190_2-20130828/26110_1 /ASSEMBLY_ACC=CAM_ASM_000263 /TAXON_ID=37353 /ORGANISM="Rosalina sp." /LENGTH=535 /DNA_ID=CAMNT_0048012699 /DNA_START=79 /DNA_END=1686 /DNA_ORIENTATION=-